jgi:hypothetical protein
VVDQFAAWVAAERLPLLPPDGGFARLRREGLYVRQLEYQHSATDTAPGHASLYTGGPPRISGITGNEQPVDLRHSVSILRDPTTLAVNIDGPVQGLPGSSAARLQSDTVADRLRAAHPEAVIVSLSIKDRGAIFGGGRHPTASIWFDIDHDEFVTSTAFARQLPAWARGLVERPSVQALRHTPWTVSDPTWLKRHVTTTDDQPGEGDFDGLGTTFPHVLTQAMRPSSAFRATPIADESLLRLAVAALDGAGLKERRTPALLAISFSSNDYVGHIFGPTSWEHWDNLYRLDRTLGRLLAALDERLGPDGYAVMLSGDHGVGLLPETIATTHAACAGAKPGAAAPNDPWHRHCGGGERLHHDLMAEELEAEARRALGKGRWVLGVADPWVHFRPEALALPPARRDRLVKALVRRLSKHPGVARVYDVRSLAGECPPYPDVSEPALACRSYRPGSDTGLYIVTHPGSFFDTHYARGRGLNHGSPYLFDRTVPLLVRAPGRVPAGRMLTDPHRFDAFARTAAALLEIPPPSAATGGTDLTRSAATNGPPTSQRSAAR